MTRQSFQLSCVKALLFPALILAAFGSTNASALAKKEPLRLMPASKWAVDYREDGCTLARQFGEGEEKSVVYFHRFSPGDNFKLTLGGPTFKNFSANNKASIQFGPNEQVQELEYFPGSISAAKLPAMVFKGTVSLGGLSAEEKEALKKNLPWESSEGLPKIELDDARRSAISHLAVGKPGGRYVILEMGPMAKPMEALTQCIDNLVSSWGIDVEKHKNMTRPVEPVGNPGKWIVSADYPRDMLADGQPAIVEFRLNVDPQGAVSACHIQATTRPKEFDDAVCRALQRRAKFTAALDASGQPMASFWKSTVQFEIGGRRP